MSQIRKQHTAVDGSSPDRVQIIRSRRGLYRGLRGLLVAVVCLTMFSACAQVSRSLGWRSEGQPEDPELNPAKTAEVQFALGRTLEQQGQRDQARAAYASSLRHDPQNGLACWRLAVLAAAAGRQAEADRYFGRAVDLIPESAEIHTDIGYSHYLRRDLETATMHLRQAIVLHESHQRAHNILGLVLAMQGRDLEAAREFSAAGLEPADIACNLGYVAMRSGNSGTADEMFAHALELVPGHTTAQRYFTVSASESSDAVARPNRVQHADWVDSPELSVRNVRHALEESTQQRKSIHE